MSSCLRACLSSAVRSVQSGSLQPASQREARRESPGSGPSHRAQAAMQPQGEGASRASAIY
eukprot:CAMPEP_0174725126 /NCGR_PEP_ID=MMETSP1094-20130205/44865_1 /TAXON_ID=156173 /ORGANISM="Chrysochromulina brevifilum, Strain UTEX LB 985" /LENGTH=60 /DNA_ID=CAMNT_0015926471 /DNA_START=542 /DNA_END=722 /DNA_ORIENTATION=+